MAFGAPETVNNGVVTGLPMQIPYSTEQRIIFAKQGILSQEQGILWAELKSSRDEIFGNLSAETKTSVPSGMWLELGLARSPVT